MKPRDVLRSIKWIALLAVPAYALLAATAGTVHDALAQLATDLLWAAPFVLAISVSLFGSMLRVFDHIKDALEELDQSRRARANALAQETGAVISGLLQNGIITIIAGVSSVALRMLKEIKPVVELPYLQNEWLATALQVGFAGLIVRILIAQFQAVPEFVELYRFFAVDRRLGRKQPPGDKHISSGESGALSNPPKHTPERHLT